MQLFKSVVQFAFRGCSDLLHFTRCGFLTTEPNAIVSPIHQKAMPVILTKPEEVDLWLSVLWEEVKRLQRPLQADMLVVVEPPAKPEAAGSLL